MAKKGHISKIRIDQCVNGQDRQSHEERGERFALCAAGNIIPRPKECLREKFFYGYIAFFIE